MKLGNSLPSSSHGFSISGEDAIIILEVLKKIS